MVKRKYKDVARPTGGIKKKIPKVRPTDAMVPAHAHRSGPAEAIASNSASKGNEDLSIGKEKKLESLSGFIFMCSLSTKSECYQYRVFGLPVGKMDVVEKIKPGTKLFLFDFELKLLYGIYEATSEVQLNLEPEAFRGKFPVQVKFRIFKECLPVHESLLRHFIKKNYKGSKFNQELNEKQVLDLLSAFRPLDTSSQFAPRDRLNVPLSNTIPLSVTEDQFKHTSRLLAVEDPCLAGLPYGRAPPLFQPLSVLKVLLPQHVEHRTSSYADRFLPTSSRLGIPGIPVTINHYAPDARQPYFTGDSTHRVQDHYPRYMNIRELADTDLHARRDGTSFENTSLGREHGQLPLQRQVPYQGSASASYIPTMMQPQARTASSHSQLLICWDNLD